MILVIDNYDSFVYNLACYVAQLGSEYEVIRNDQMTVDAVLAKSPSHIIISPGPKAPRDAGISVSLIKAAAGRIPILGVCLGHQAIAEAFGGQVARASVPMHGKQDKIYHHGQDIFKGIHAPLSVARYHSLIVTLPLPYELEIMAWNQQQQVMAIKHRDWPIFGVQFHPESILTEQGHSLLANFLKSSLPSHHCASFAMTVKKRQKKARCNRANIDY